MRVAKKASPVSARELGVSLLEVLFATAAVSLVLVAVLSTIIGSLQNSRSSLEQTKATQYSRQILEWLRQERDSAGWIPFTEQMPAPGNTRGYCLPAVPADLPRLSEMEGECDTEDVIPETIYTRSLEIQRVSAAEVRAVVTVSRPDSSGTVNTSTELILTEWQ